MRFETHRCYEERLTDVVSYIASHLDDELGYADLADIACLSRFHFARVFRGMVGEAVGEFVRRLRMERAAYQLLTTEHSVLEIGVEARYESHESFTRAFRTHYRVAPSRFRLLRTADHRIPAPCGVHYHPEGKCNLHVRHSGLRTMKAEIRHIDNLRLLGLRHVGPYHEIGHAFNKLFAWIGQRGLPLHETVAVYYDDPESTPATDLRSDAAVVLPDGVPLPELDGGLTVIEVPAADYAVARYTGPYDGLGDAWTRFMGEAVPATGREMGLEFCFERYLNDPSSTPPDQLETDLYQAVR